MGLKIVHYRLGNRLNSVSCQDGLEAWRVAIRMITAQPFLEAGDSFVVFDNGDSPGELPEPGRQSHYSA